MKEDYLRIDSKENAIDFLERAAEFLENIPTEIKWKWIIISLHGALYGFAIAAIQGTDAKRVLREDGKLISIWEALKRVQDPEWMNQYTDSKVRTLTPEENYSIQKLSDEFRNNFEHFSPSGWSIEVSGMPKISLNVAGVIEFLAFDSGNILLDDYEVNRIKSAIQRIRSSLTDDN